MGQLFGFLVIATVLLTSPQSLCTNQSFQVFTEYQPRLLPDDHQIEDLPVNFRFHGFSSNIVLNAAQKGAVDMLQLTSAALSAVDKLSNSFLRYFQREDHKNVMQVFEKIIAESAYVDSEEIQMIDFYFDQWDKLPSRAPKSADNKNLLAVALEGIVQSGDKNVILCSTLFEGAVNSLDDVKCQSLKQFATWRSMDVIGASILHEMLHLGTLLGISIGDITTEVLDIGEVPGYGPYGAMMVNKVDQLGVLNADNYVWFALESWFQEECGLAGFEDPPVEIISISL